MTTKPLKITDLQLKKLASSHVDHFEDLVARAKRGERGLRIHECDMYLRVWRNIFRKAVVDLSAAESAEVWDAIESGDYDHIFAA